MSMYEDHPCNSDGEFISNPEDALHISATKVLVPAMPPADDTCHVLDGLTEVEEGLYGNLNDIAEQDPIRYYSILQAHDDNAITSSSLPVMPAKSVTSPLSTQAVRNSLKCDCALTVSSAGSKDKCSAEQQCHNSQPVRPPSKCLLYPLLSDSVQAPHAHDCIHAQ
ncbi:hypothetical protein JVT61DRAFT_10343 [Boletus reticuloceps]|uniref:Uncharacterized protein n=1 Tax=Boletus reticuloceps TaxID=495285 RepID=A0A8I2YZD7_9AGAM|nr:hypothetical protein JVT61DRAFT_10343 [Boletus reticuloceps]